MENSSVFDDDSPPEPKEGWLLVRIHVPELNVYKCLQFPSDRLVWDVKQQVLSSLPKELKESFNYGLFCPPSNGKAGKFLDEERRLGDYPFNGPVGYLELKYKRRVYKMLNLDERQLKALHTRANLRRFLDCINGGHVEKIAKMCAKGLDPNFHCPESGDTPLTVATGAKKPNKLLIALVNGGAILDYRTKDGTTALHKAVERDSLEAVTTLLELGASPNYKDVRGLTPVYLSITKKCDPKITESLLHDHATLGTQDTQGWQEVHQACRHGLIHHLEHLLSYGADMDGHNASGNTPLHVCAVNNQEACARMLLFRGAQRGALNYANQTPYQVAVIAGNMELAEMIQNFKNDEIVPFRGPPRYNPRRRSGLGWQISTTPSANHLHPLYIQHQMSTSVAPPPPPPQINYHQTNLLYNDHSGPGSIISNGSILSTLTSRNSLCIIGGPPSPCPSEHMPYSSASSSLSEGSSGHRSHEDDISIVTDKSLGDTSDIISDSSGVGTNSDSAACSIGHPSTTVVCMEAYSSNEQGHLRLQPGDVIEVVGSTDCGYLEGYVRGTNRSGFFPGECVQEVSIRQKNITNVSTANSSTLSPNAQRTSAQVADSQQLNGNGSQYSSATAPRIKKPQAITFSAMTEQRTVILHRAKRGFGFVLRGAKASSPLMQLKPSERFPALQYLDGVDPGGVADMAGLKPGDFLLTINGEDVRAASHEQVVEMIRSSGALVSMTVVSPHFQSQLSPQQLQLQQPSGAMSPTQQSASRQCATLPRKMSMGPGVKAAPAPPRRDPKTTLSVGRARAKSMVAGLENGGEKDDGDDMPTTKSNSVESITHSGTPSLNPGTPTQMRTASIKSRPSSSRITAAELEELFQRQQGENADITRFSTMMTTSRFQSGTDSGTTTPPVNGSPMKSSGPIVYGSVAEMKRKKTKNASNGYGTLRGKPCAIPTVGGDLKRFHSTPDLNTKLTGSDVSIWNHAGANSAKGHHSQDDVATLHASLQRLNLPPPTHPPPPPPVGQVVKVDVSRTSEYESTLALQQALKKRAELTTGNKNAEGVASTFKPSTNAKLYASPQELKNMGWKDNTNQQQNNNGTLQRKHVPQSPQPTAQNQSQYARPTIVTNSSQVVAVQPQVQQIYQPPIVVDTGNVVTVNGNMVPQGPAPPIPDPDYSLSEDESDGDDENSILVARNTKLNEKIALIDVPDNGNASANINSSNNNNNNNNGTPPSSSSISHSFSVEEIQKMRTKLKTSKSYPNDLLAKEKEDQQEKDEKDKITDKIVEPKEPNQQERGQNEENGSSDNSSSGVSSDQDIPANNTDTIKKKPVAVTTTTTTPPPTTTPSSSSTVSISNQNQSSLVQSTKVKSCIVKSQQLNLNTLPIMSSKIANTTTPAPVAVVPTTAVPKKPILKNPLNVTRSPQPVHHEIDNGLAAENCSRSDDEYYDDAELSPSPPSKPFQRHNSLTRKQAATIAMNRATVTTARPAVSLVQLPPPIEGDNEHESVGVAVSRSKISAASVPDNEIVLAPPPQFCDCQHKQQHVHLQPPQQQQRQPHQLQPQHFPQQQQQQHQLQHVHHIQQQHMHHQHQHQQHVAMQQMQTQQRVRIVGAVPKANYRLHSQ